jgi:hypothetical protein
MGKATPSPSNYTGAANQQAAASQQNTNQQTAANRPNVNGNTQSQQWTQGSDGQWTLNQGYGQSQGLADTLRNQAQSAYGSPMDDGSTARQQTIDSAYGQAQKRLDPQWEQRGQLADSTLANQGIDPNSAAAQGARREFSNSRNDAYGSAMSGAIREGNAAGSEVFRNNLMARNNPLQQLLALSGLSGPSYNTAGKADSPDILAATMGQDSANLRAWQAQQQATADAIGAGGQLLGGIAKAAFSF